MLTVAHLYPDLLNLYGDRGNVMAFVRRCRWRNIPVQVKEVNIGEPMNLEEVDFLFLGGGSDREQTLLTKDLESRAKALQETIEEDLVLLAICGGYQMLGRYYRTHEGEEIPGLGILDFYTEAGPKRLIGNVAVEITLDDKVIKATGFENHSGQTFLGDIKPFGKVLAGFGNNGRDSQEGARYKNVFCTYMHGPLLPKNTVITDYLISLGLKRRGITTELETLEDSFEERANNVMLERLLKNAAG